MRILELEEHILRLTAIPKGMISKQEQRICAEEYMRLGENNFLEWFGKRFNQPPKKDEEKSF